MMNWSWHDLDSISVALMLVIERKERSVIGNIYVDWKIPKI